MSIFLDKRIVLDRIKELYQLKNNAKLASFLGIPPTTLSSWYSRNTLDLDIIYEKCVGINWQWLLTGEGSMLLDNKTSEESKRSSTPIATPISPVEESIIYKMYQEEKAENKALIEEIGGLKERIRQLESQDKESDCPTAASLVTEAFTSESYGDYGEGSSPMKPSTTSKRSSAGKT